MTTRQGFRRSKAILFAGALSIAVLAGFFGLRGSRVPDYGHPLRVGIDHAPPYQMLRADGGVEGLSVDMLGEAARRRGIRIVFVPIRGPLPDEAMRANLADIWPAAAATDERRRWLHVTEPWLSNRYALIGVKGAALESPRVVAAKRISILGQAFKEKFPASKIVLFPERFQAMQAACSGQADAALVETRYMNQALLERPQGCENVNLQVRIVKNLSLDLAILAKPQFGAAAEAIRAEVGRLAAEGRMGESLDRWSPFTSSETQSVYTLKEAEHKQRISRQESIGGIAVILLFFWQLVRIRRARRAEAKLTSDLKAEQERWRLAVAANNDGLFDWNEKTGEQFASARWRELIGIPAEAEIELMGEWRSRVHPDDAAQMEQTLNDYVEGRSTHYRSEFRLKHNSGEWRWMLARAYGMRDETGRVNRLVGSLTDTTERKNAEQKIVESESRYRLLFENSPLAALIYDVEAMTVVDANPLACSQYGYAEDEMTGMAVKRLVAEDEHRRLSKLRLRPEEGRLAGTWRHVRKDGSIFLAEVVSHPVSMPGHRYARVIAVSDVTEREAAHERFKILFEHSSDPHLIFDSLGVVDCNEAAIDLLAAKSKDEVLGRHPACFSPERQPDGRLSMEKSTEMDGLARERGFHRFDWTHRRMDGIDFPCEVSLTPVRLDGRETMLVVWHDLTERKRTEEKLRLLSSVAQQSTSGILITDAEERIVYVNPAFERQTGYEATEAEGKLPIDILRCEGDESITRLRRGIESRAGVSVELRCFRKDDTPYYAELNVAPVFDGSGCCTHFVTVENDVTDRKKSEDALRSAMYAAEAAARAKSEFLAVMSHEIRTPMNGVIGMTSLLLDTPLNEEQREQLETIRISGRALLTVINDILDFSKIEAGKMELETIEFNLRQTMEETIEMVSDAVSQKNLLIYGTIDEDVPAQVWGDPGRVRQVLLNYVGNSVKFTERGEIRIHISREDGEAGPMVRWSVTDTGVGLSKEQKARLFEAFTQADSSTTRRFGGTGLGLAICRTLAKLMGGSVGVTSVAGGGSTFWFTMRLEASDKSMAIPLPAALEGKHVLLMDGNTGRRIATECRLKEAGLRYAIADSEVQAADAMGCPTIDVAILSAGRFDLETVLAMALRRRLPVMLLAGPHEGTIPAVIKATPQVCVLTKPMRQSRFLLELATLVHGDQLVSSAVEPARESVQPVSKTFNARVLLAEDNAVNQKVARMMLSRLGCTARCAVNGREAVALAQAERFDLILMDCQMPEMDGYEATREIRRQERTSGGRVPIIALTANSLGGEKERCTEAGMDFYLSKPVRLETLAAAIEQLISVSREVEVEADAELVS